MRQRRGKGWRLAVGFNRRFSDHCTEAKKFLGERNNPLVMVYRANAGQLPADHWTQDPDVGGGRILGEACHFVDYMQAVCGGLVETVHANSIANHTSGMTQDQSIISMTFSDARSGRSSTPRAATPGLPRNAVR